MEFKFPKNDAKYHWTNHVGRKMMFYGLSADRIKRVMRNPKRSEKGIAEGTIAVMQPTNSKKPSEVWVMYAEVRHGRTSGLKLKAESLRPIKKVVITAWRYPGISPIRDQIPIPADILEELKRDGVILKGVAPERGSRSRGGQQTEPIRGAAGTGPRREFK